MSEQALGNKFVYGVWKLGKSAGVLYTRRKRESKQSLSKDLKFLAFFKGQLPETLSHLSSNGDYELMWKIQKSHISLPCSCSVLLRLNFWVAALGEKWEIDRQPTGVCEKVGLGPVKEVFMCYLRLLRATANHCFEKRR